MGRPVASSSAPARGPTDRAGARRGPGVIHRSGSDASPERDQDINYSVGICGSMYGRRGRTSAVRRGAIAHVSPVTP